MRLSKVVNISYTLNYLTQIVSSQELSAKVNTMQTYTVSNISSQSCEFVIYFSTYMPVIWIMVESNDNSSLSRSILFHGKPAFNPFFTRRNNTFWDIPAAASLGGQLNMFSRVINDPNSLWLDVLFNLTLSLSPGGYVLVPPMNQPEFPGARLSTNVVELAWRMYKAR